MKKQNKYSYGWNIWTNYGYGWEIECTYDKSETTKQQVCKDAREYRLNGAQVKVTSTRWMN